MSPADNDDIDRRFRELMRHEFDEEPAPFRGPTSDEPSNLLEAWDRADALDDDAHYIAELQETSPWPPLTVLAAASLCVGIMMWLLAMARIALPSWATAVGAVCAVAGLVGLMIQALRRSHGTRDDSHDSGAVL